MFKCAQFEENSFIVLISNGVNCFCDTVVIPSAILIINLSNVVILPPISSLKNQDHSVLDLTHNCFVLSCIN